MEIEVGLLAAMLLGFLGSGHCVGMCGGIACALTIGLDPEIRGNPARLAPYLVGYNVGRIASYSIAGAVAGLAGLRLGDVLPAGVAPMAGFTLSGLILVAAGAYVGGWRRGLAWLERAGAYPWRWVEPLGRRLLPVRRPGQAVVLGIVWGWLPCGLVYAALVLALTAGGPVNGALQMAAFGIGTLPMLLVLGTAGATVAAIGRNPGLRRWAGACVAGLGLMTLAGAVSLYS